MEGGVGLDSEYVRVSYIERYCFWVIVIMFIDGFEDKGNIC